MLGPLERLRDTYTWRGSIAGSYLDCVSGFVGEFVGIIISEYYERVSFNWLTAIQIDKHETVNGLQSTHLVIQIHIILC